ncbi:MAG: AMP-binding protein, partial [Clostridia bacterium]|nr:AMP-binding protein [Clostridia bacterium]
MRLSLSTNGWEKYGWNELFDAAREAGFSGIELHGLSRDMTGPGMPFSPQRISSTASHLRDIGFRITCVDALCDVADPAAADEAICEISECISTAVKLRCGFVRIRAGAEGEDDTVAALIKRVLPIAEADRVTVLLETAGVYSDTARLSALLGRFASDSLGALWDMHNPYRFSGESAEDVIEHLGAHIKHVHIRDSAVTGGGEIQYRLIGEGDLPVSEMIDALRSVGYAGFISCECNPADFDELGDKSILLPHFCGYMSRFESEGRGPRRRLEQNRSKTGRFIWPKGDLIDLTFPEVLDRVAEEFPDQLAFKYTTLDYTRTYTQFREDADSFAASLIALGVGSGDHVAIWATNIPQWFITFWACVRIGAVLVTVNTAYKIHEAEYLLRQSDTHTLVMIESCRDSDYRGIISELCPEMESAKPGRPLHCSRLPFLRNVITVGFSMKGGITWEDALARGRSVHREEVLWRSAAVRPDDVANMQYTSGTTGFPKGVMLTHRNIVNNGKCI